MNCVLGGCKLMLIFIFPLLVSLIFFFHRSSGNFPSSRRRKIKKSGELKTEQNYAKSDEKNIKISLIEIPSSLRVVFFSSLVRLWKIVKIKKPLRVFAKHETPFFILSFQLFARNGKLQKTAAIEKKIQRKSFLCTLVGQWCQKLR